ncbi:unnamed protein product, partial [Rotaria magnacalcarata]
RNAIIRFLAREFNLYGTGNCEHTVVDIVLELTRRFQEKLFEQMNNSTTLEQQKANLTQFLADHATDYLNQLENIDQILHYPQGPFYLGCQISIADLVVYQTITYLLDLDPKLLSNYCKLLMARCCLEKHPRLANYLNSKKLKLVKKRNTTTSPPSHHSQYDKNHHRHRSHEENNSFHRQHAEQSPPPIHMNSQSKTSSTSSKERSPSPLITERIPTPPSKTRHKVQLPFSEACNENSSTLSGREHQSRMPRIPPLETILSPPIHMEQKEKPTAIAI